MLWHADHVNFGRLLNLLEGELRRLHDDRSPDYELMLDIMYYMTHYSDVLHHPKEISCSRASRHATAKPDRRSTG
jgi:hemerythrin-like domain-containing protein